MIQVGKRVGSHDTSGKEGGFSRDHQYQDDMLPEKIVKEIKEMKLVGKELRAFF